MPDSSNWTDRFRNLIIGVTGVITGALLSYYYTLQKGRQDTTFELYHEFNSIDMSRIRHYAWEMIKESPDSNTDQLLKEYPDNGNLLLIVTRFYQKLYYNVINKRFGDIHYL